MGYTIQAIIAAQDILLPVLSWIADSKVNTLNQNMAMIPVTEEFYDQFILENTRAEDNPFDSMYLLSLPIATRLAKLSERGSISYIQADFFGGIGYQGAVV